MHNPTNEKIKKEPELKRTGKGGDLSRNAPPSQFFDAYREDRMQREFSPVKISPK